MRVELNQGTYRIKPNVVRRQGNPQPVNPIAPINKGVAPQSGENQLTVHAPDGSTTIQRGQDVAQLSSLNLQAAQKDLPQVDQFHARLKPLVAGQTNRPMSFDAVPPAKTMNIYDQAYFRHTADHAALNAAAVERTQVDLRG